MTTSTAPGARTLGDFPGTIVLVGAGKMGGAMLDAWLALGLPPTSVVVLEPQPTRELGLLASRGLRINPSITQAREASAIVMAVKPQVAATVTPTLAPYFGAATVMVSIMAGRTLGFLESALGQRAALVRAMPNTPAVDRPRHHGRGPERAGIASPARARARAALRHRRGRMDDRRGADGRGHGGLRLRPAYVFLLAEALAQAGAAAGLPRDLAVKLARATVSGSGELLSRSTTDPATLRQNVTSPGGTTAAALDVLMAPDGLAVLMAQGGGCRHRALARARWLAHIPEKPALGLDPGVGTGFPKRICATLSAAIRRHRAPF